MSERYIKTDSGSSVYISLPKECPRCHIGIQPNYLYAHVYENANHQNLCTAIFKCPVCEDLFMATFLIDKMRHYIFMKECGPAEEKRKEFDTNLQKISPKFCEIYNEALIAEGKGLREICGIGYRKALEFLIKDYLIENNPSEKETIKKSYLGKCIKDYIDDPNIKTLAEKTAWLGNDETHFLRTYDDMDTVETMKRFINAILYFIETQLAIAEAGQIQPKKQKKS